MKKFLLALIALALATVLGAGVVQRYHAEHKSAELARQVHRQIFQESILRVFREHNAALNRWASHKSGTNATTALNSPSFYQALTQIDTSLCPEDFTSAWQAYVEIWNPAVRKMTAHPADASVTGFGGDLAQREQENTALDACRSIAEKYGLRFNSPASLP